MKYFLTLLLTIQYFFTFGQNSTSANDTIKGYKEFRKNLLKVEVFAYKGGNFTLGYERLLKEFISVETRLGIIGAGRERENQRGAFLRAGVKFLLDSKTSKEKNLNPLRGFYVRPDILIGRYHYEEWVICDIENRKNTIFSVTANIGFQHFMSKRLIFDVYVGLGLGNTTSINSGNYYGFYTLEFVYNYHFNAGFSLGYAF